MSIRKFRWSKVYESAEEELETYLEKRHITAHRWTAEPGEEIPSRPLAHPTTIWCAEGTVICTINEKTYSLQPGDALELPANTAFQGVAGFGGCVCYESLSRR